MPLSPDDLAARIGQIEAVGPKLLEMVGVDGDVEDVSSIINLHIKTLSLHFLKPSFDELRALPSAERMVVLQEWLEGFLQKDFKLFWRVLEMAVTTMEEPEGETLEAFLEWNADWVEVCRSLMSSNPDQGAFEASIRKNIKKPARSQAMQGLMGAKVLPPKPIHEAAGKWAGDDKDPRVVYEELAAMLSRDVEAATDGKHEGVVIGSVAQAWHRLENMLEDSMGPLKVLITSNSYKPLVTDTRQYFTLNVESLQTLLLEAHWALMMRRKQPVLLISTVTQLGERMDAKAIADALKAEFPNLLVVLDAAQDREAYPWADAVLYSKRLCASGTGVAMLSKTLAPELSAKFRGESSVAIRDLAMAASATWHHFVRKARPVHLGRLLASPEEWREERPEPQLALPQELANHFELRTEEKPIYSLVKKDGSPIQLAELNQEAVRTLGFALDIFSPDLIRFYVEEPEDAASVQAALQMIEVYCVREHSA